MPYKRFLLYYVLTGKLIMPFITGSYWSKIHHPTCYTNAFRKSAVSVSVSAAIESVMIFWFGSAYHASLLVHLPELWPDEWTERWKVERRLINWRRVIARQ